MKGHALLTVLTGCCVFMLIFTFLCPFSVKAGKHPDSISSRQVEILEKGFYLVIGVFEYEKNAKKLLKVAVEEDIQASYKRNPLNENFYVVVDNGLRKEDVIDQYIKLRKKTIFKDAWIYMYTGQRSLSSAAKINHQRNSDNLNIEQVNGKSSQNNLIGLNSQKNKEAKSEYEKIMVFSVSSLDNNKALEASIEIIDPVRAKLIKKVTSSIDSWYMQIEECRLDTIGIIAQAIGYRPLKVNYSPQQPLNDTTAMYTILKGDTVVISLELHQLQEGDFQIMYNTYFYGNSTVMREQSLYEIERLYDVLADNENLYIRLHGHTNGDARGLAYLFLEDKRNYFQIVRTKEYRKRGMSSRKLSESRAKTIKSYLVMKGIDPARIETKGWGGKKLLYDTGSPLAKNNIRVEIEVLSKE